MSVMSAPTSLIDRNKTASPQPPDQQRLLSLDVYRGLIMVSLICYGFGLRTFDKDPKWGFLARQVDHSQWTGVVFWDIIQPAFLFMVGVAMPFAFARRKAMGATKRDL